MPTIHIPQKKRSLEVDDETTIFTALRVADLPIASSCQGDAVCGRCLIHIVNGIENVSAIDVEEVKMSDRLHWQIENPNNRIRAACKVRVLKNEITIKTSYW